MRQKILPHSVVCRLKQRLRSQDVRIFGRNHWPQGTTLWLVCLVSPMHSSSDSLRSCSGLKLWVIGLPQLELVKGSTTLAPLLIILILMTIPSHMKPFNWWSEQEAKQILSHQLVWQRVTHSKEWVFFCQRPFVPWMNEVFSLCPSGQTYPSLAACEVKNTALFPPPTSLISAQRWSKNQLIRLLMQK